MKLPIGPIGIFQPGAGADHRLRNRRHGFVLADHALVQFFFEMQQLLHFAFEQARHRNAGPAADDRGDILFADFFLQKFRRARGDGFGGRQFGGKLAEFTVLQLGGAVQIVCALRLIDLRFHLIDLLAQSAQGLHGFFFELPAGLQCVALGAQVGGPRLQSGSDARARPRPSLS